MTRFLLIRHATTDAVGKKLSGRKPGVLLNAAGAMEAQKLADGLAEGNITAIYSSPLERARETAAPLAMRLGLEVVLDEHFIELDFGEWTDAAFEDLSSDASFQRFNFFRSCSRIPGGESMVEAQMRMVNGLERLRRKHEHQTVAVISHSDVIKSAVAFYAGMHLDMLQRLEISPASVSVVELYDDTARIVALNYTGSVR
ncbi:MAG TPA: histidine phosphatase family protein [Chitinophagaceae bacterium]|nr:histidine phosphatase family protein [Chitinophagaceae bacterium]